MKKLLLLGIAAVALTAAPVQAGGLNLKGVTGLANTPVAGTSPAMSLSLAADYVGSEDTLIPMRLNFGIIDGLEIGGMYDYIDQDGDPAIWGIGAKYVIPAQLVENLGLALGVDYSAMSSDFMNDDLTTLSGYLVATYTIDAGIPIKPSLGLSFEKQEMGDWDESGVRFFGSLIVMVLPELAVAGEFVSTNEDLDGNDADADIWFGARYMTPLKGLAVQAGAINNVNIGGDDPKDFVFHIGAQYNFSFAN